MQKPVTRHVDATPATATERAPRGPVVLDSQLLQWVAGGAPKGGWGVDAPKGGWGLDAEAERAPKGGW